MEDHIVLCVDQLVSNKSLHSSQSVEVADASCSHAIVSDMKGDVEFDAAGEEEPLIQSVECRICQDEDTIKNMEVPCACNGSLKFAHRKCVQRWCNEKGDTICEICHKVYEPGYTAPSSSDDTVLDISGSWTLNGTSLDLNNPRLLAMAAAERSRVDAEYEDTNANGASFCRSAALILMALLLLRHALTIGDGDDDGDDDASVFLALFMLRAAGFLLPCYIMAWVVSILQRRRQAQETERLAAAADVAFMLQSGQNRGLQITIAPGSVVAPEPTVASASPVV